MCFITIMRSTKHMPRKYTAAQKRAYAKRMKSRRGRAAQKKFQLRRPKSSVVKSLQPIIETKKFLGWGGGATPGPVTSYLPVIGPSKLIVPDAFCFMTGDTNAPNGSFVDGNDVFSRFLRMKIKVTYPNNANAPDSKQVQPVELIHGWCKPTNWTHLTTPPLDTASREDITTHVLNQVAYEFNEADDNMKFPDKMRRNYNIISRRKLIPNNNGDVFQNTWDVGTVTQQGGPTPIMRHCDWSMKKKVELIESSDSRGAHDPFMYPNQAYIPFVLLYNPSYTAYALNEGSAITQIQIQHNACHWFNDA